MFASDLTVDDIGAEIEIPIGDHQVFGKLSGLSWPLGMVRLTFDNDGTQTSIAMDGSKNITVTREHARFRAVTEPDLELRGKWLHEVNHLSVMQQVGELLGDAS